MDDRGDLMSIWHAILLGALQGVTEFLPVSSSGHLVLAQHFLRFSEEGEAKDLFFDGMLHFGTAIAVLLYFRQGLRQQVRQHLGRSSSGGGEDAGGSQEAPWPATRGDLFYLGVLVGLATLPAAVVTLLRSEQIKESFKDPTAVAVNFLILGVLLIGISF